MPRFSIIIVSWNALHHLKTFLPSVNETSYPDYEIILADNASTDGSKKWVRRHFPEVKMVTLDRNYGYCGGNNRAVSFATGDILLFLNNDVKVEPDWLTPLGQLFERNDQLGAAQPKMRSYKHPGEFEYAGAAGGYLDHYGFPFCRGRIFDTVEKDEGQYDTEENIFWASGAALAVRKQLFSDLGGFDESFEFHMEEIDLCWQLWNEGFKVKYCPESVVYHLGGGSLPMDSPRKLYYNYRNSLTMLYKNYSKPVFTRLSGRMMLDLVAILREFVTGHLSNGKAIFKAYLHFFKNLQSTRKKRRYIQRKRKNSADAAPLQPFSVVWQYFVKDNRTFSDLPQTDSSG